jgi:hypothetical protein
MGVYEEQLEREPGLRERMEAIERHTRYILSRQTRTTDEIVTIPVVVHVVWNQQDENLSEAQILSQIDVLNEDFRRLNADTNDIWPQAADTRIEFCMARTDPQGLATCGITRTETEVTSFGASGDPVKFSSSGGIDAWPAEDYLNIWVCDLSPGLLGYAQFPGGDSTTDGVVVDYYYFGRIGNLDPDFNLGRTTTHEVGHWLNLRHIWGDGPCPFDDLVDDTPSSNNPNYGCQIGSQACGSEDMVQNYMDYSDDACMNLFTQGQKDRMRAIFEPEGARFSLISSAACNLPEQSVYTFTGPGTDWSDGGNWDSGNVPSVCFNGTIVIAHDCIATGIEPLRENIELIVESGVVLTWQ